MKLPPSLLLLASALVLLRRTVEAAPPDNKPKGYEKNGGGGGGGPKKTAVNGPPCATDGDHCNKCGSDVDGARNQCCHGLVCSTGEPICVDPCGPAVSTCCTEKCESKQKLKAEEVSSDCCRIPLTAGTFPMIGECIKPGEMFNDVMINSCEQLEVKYTGGSLGGCEKNRKNLEPVCMCNAEVVVKAGPNRDIIAEGQTPSAFYESDCKL